LAPAHGGIQPSAAWARRTDLRHLTIDDWCVHPHLVPCQQILFIPEEFPPHVRGPHLFIDPEDIIYHDLPSLYYHVYIDILEVKDWSPPSPPAAPIPT
jgi:hypothetical protein